MFQASENAPTKSKHLITQIFGLLQVPIWRTVFSWLVQMCRSILNFEKKLFMTIMMKSPFFDMFARWCSKNISKQLMLRSLICHTFKTWKFNWKFWSFKLLKDFDRKFCCSNCTAFFPTKKVCFAPEAPIFSRARLTPSAAEATTTLVFSCGGESQGRTFPNDKKHELKNGMWKMSWLKLEICSDWFSDWCFLLF